MFEDKEFNINIKYDKKIRQWRASLTCDFFEFSCFGIDPEDALTYIAKYFHQNIVPYKPYEPVPMVDNSNE